KSGQPITAHAVSRILRDAGIHPVSLHIQRPASGGRGSTASGYSRESFTTAFTRYLPSASIGQGEASGGPEVLRVSEFEQHPTGPASDFSEPQSLNSTPRTVA